MKLLPCGLGDAQSRFSVYIANRPPLDDYQQLVGVQAMQPGEISHIAQQTGNHWRKIFNVYAKLVYALEPQGFASWQHYREEFLLQKHSKQALLFSAPDLSRPGLHLIMGRAYARAYIGTCAANDDKNLALNAELLAVDADFQVDPKKRLVVTPYFDYRQLSNEKLARLRALISHLHCYTG